MILSVVLLAGAIGLCVLVSVASRVKAGSKPAHAAKEPVPAQPVLEGQKGLAPALGGLVDVHGLPAILKFLSHVALEKAGQLRKRAQTGTEWSSAAIQLHRVGLTLPRL